MVLPVTLTSAAAAALIAFWLARRIFTLRISETVAHGDGGKPHLARRIRAHSNFTEYTPIVLILCAAIELAGRGGPVLSLTMAAYLLARVAHAIGMDSEAVPATRKAGMAVTFLVLIGLAVFAVLIAAGVA